MESQSTNESDQLGNSFALVGWLAVIVNLAYATWIYFGVAPPPGGMATDWWHGRTFILDMESMGGYVDNPGMGAFLIGIPSLLLSAITFFATRSAVAKAVALGTTFTAVLFALVGYAAAFAWEGFSWRFTAVAVASGMALGSALVAPLLTRSWLRQSPIVRVILYLPIFLLLITAVRGATGTSEHMRFMVSPWPVFTSIALDAGVILISSFLFALSIGVLSLGQGVRGFPAMIGVLIAATIPSLPLWLGYSSVLPDLSPGIFLTLGFSVGLLAFISTIYRGSGDRGEALRARGLILGLGAALAFLPIFSGHVLASGDYAATRYILAPKLIEALEAHIVAEEFFPEDLNDLVEAGYYDELPRPREGFAILSSLGLADEVKYRYNEYGSSYVLEFDAGLWIQCTYSGQYYFDDDDEEYDEDEEEYDDEESDWSCLGKAPAIMDAGQEEEDEDDYEYDD